MTRRLVLVIVASVAATLLVVGVTTLGFARLQARSRTEADLRSLAASINEGLLRAGPAAPSRSAAANAFRRALRLDGIELMALSGDGGLVGRLPPGVPDGALEPAVLAGGSTQSGRVRDLVWVADPVELRARTVVTVVTRRMGSGVAAAVGWFLLASVVTLLLGAIVAVIVGRRLGRPVRQADEAARRIAAGELSTRLTPPAGRPGDELVDLAGAINAMAESLERSKGLEQQFLLSVSHDLRTPLTAIRGYAEAITDGTAPNVGQAAAVISREARRLERLVADLLDLARLDARAFSLVIGAVDLAAAARAVIAAADPVTVRLGLEVTLSAPDAPVWVMADPERLEQVIANLLENAQRYALATISVSVRAPGSGSGSGSGTMAELSVEDDGPGIAAEDRPHVFERLYVSSHRPSRNESGSGLGLAIVHQLVSAMGGEVRAESGDTSAGDDREAAGAAGACLAFTLPYAPAR